MDKKILPEEETTEPDFFPSGEIDTEDEKLTNKQKVSLLLAGIGGFLVFLLLLFPFDALVKNFLYKIKIPGFQHDFTSVEFPLIGKKKINAFSLSTPGGSVFKTEEMAFDISLFGLVAKNLSGDIRLQSVKLETASSLYKLKTIFFSGIKLKNIAELTKLEGNLMIRISGGEISRLPDFPLVGKLDPIGINNSVLHLQIRNGNILFGKNSNLNTSIAKIFLEGNIQLNSSLAYSAINIKLCPKFTKEFEVERPDLVNTVQILPKNSSGQSCIPLVGTFDNPQFNLSKP